MTASATEDSQLMSSEIDQQSNNNQYLTFLVGDEIYGVDILRVQEIKGWTPVTSIPNTPSHIKGVLNLRGELVPIFDIRIKFNMPHVEYKATTVIIVTTLVLTTGERIIGLVVDGVWDVVNFLNKEIKDTPALGSDTDTRFISGLANFNDRNIMLLDTDQLFSEQDLQM